MTSPSHEPLEGPQAARVVGRKSRDPLDVGTQPGRGRVGAYTAMMFVALAKHEGVRWHPRDGTRSD